MEDKDTEQVILSIRVERHLRDFWVGRARMEGKSLTEVIREYLSERYGTQKFVPPKEDQ